MMIDTIHLFPILDQKLVELLNSLSPDDWEKPTVARLWKVRDVAAHLLDGNYRVISIYRDGFFAKPDREISSYGDLVAFLNQLNADWVRASQRLSPDVLTELLETSGRQYSEIMAAQDLDADAIFPVSWAGEQVSKNWFHIAREYTEKWHHQQQIREAVGKPGILTRELFLPFIDTLVRGLPHTYGETVAPAGTCIRINIQLDGPMDWYLAKTANAWVIEKTWEGTPEATVRIPAETAWKLFTKAIIPDHALSTVTIEGQYELGRVSLNLIAVMA
jgi:uncharacterized protein (TIGR03083 family)